MSQATNYPKGYEKLIIVEGVPFGVVIGSSQGRWSASVPGTDLLVDAASEDSAIVMITAAIEQQKAIERAANESEGNEADPPSVMSQDAHPAEARGCNPQEAWEHHPRTGGPDNREFWAQGGDDPEDVEPKEDDDEDEERNAPAETTVDGREAHIIRMDPIPLIVTAPKTLAEALQELAMCEAAAKVLHGALAAAKAQAKTGDEAVEAAMKALREAAEREVQPRLPI